MAEDFPEEKFESGLTPWEKLLLSRKTNRKEPCLRDLYGYHININPISEEPETSSEQSEDAGDNDVIPAVIPESLKDREIKNIKCIYIREKGEKSRCDITGCAVTSSGRVLLCDNSNGKLKMVNVDSRQQCSLKLDSAPFDVAFINNVMAVVTMPKAKTLLFVTLVPELMTDRKIKIGRKCKGILSHEDSLIVVVSSTSHVLILDHHGNVRREFRIYPFLINLFSTPTHVAINNAGDTVYVTDSINPHGFMCVRLSDGSVSESDLDLEGVHGLMLDTADNLYVCHWYNHSVQLVSKDGQDRRTLLSKESKVPTNILVDRPQCLCYRATNHTLVVACYDSDDIHVLKFV